MNTWPDGAMTPFRSEKNTNWEGAFRVPCMIRWPGKIKAGRVSNEIVSGHDWLPTFLAAVGEPDIKEKLFKGHEAAGKKFKVHLDGFNQLPYLTGQVEKSPRRGFFYFNDDGDLVALRIENWKVVFMEQRAPGTLRVWAEPFTPLRLPKLFDLRADPYERADITSNTYYDWFISQPYLIFAAQAATAKFLDDVQGVPAASEGCQLQHRPGGGEDEAEPRQRLTPTAGLGVWFALARRLIGVGTTQFLILKKRSPMRGTSRLVCDAPGPPRRGRSTRLARGLCRRRRVTSSPSRWPWSTARAGRRSRRSPTRPGTTRQAVRVRRTVTCGHPSCHRPGRSRSRRHPHAG